MARGGRDGKEGYVYILTNKAMPGLVKIGMTRRTPKIRARELYTTSVPYPFEVYHAIKVADCEEAERAMHESLRRLRASHSREFFAVEPELAAQLLEKSVRDFKARKQGYGLLLTCLFAAVIGGGGYWLWSVRGTVDRTEIIAVLIAAAVILGLLGSGRTSGRRERRNRR